MTVSKLTLQKNLTDALILMVKTVGDTWLNSVSFNPLEPQFENILKTTWTDLENERYVTPNHEQDNEYYTLLPKGWLKGIQEDNDSFQNRLHELSKALNAKIKGPVERKAVGRHRALAGTEELAKETGIPEGFICNAIDCDLIGVYLKRKGAKWMDNSNRGKLICIPNNFGQPL